jgi:hypothetical protein
MMQNSRTTIPVIIDRPSGTATVPAAPTNNAKTVSTKQEWIDWLMLRKHAPGSGPPPPATETEGNVAVNAPPGYAPVPQYPPNTQYPQQPPDTYQQFMQCQEFMRRQQQFQQQARPSPQVVYYQPPPPAQYAQQPTYPAPPVQQPPMQPSQYAIPPQYPPPQPPPPGYPSAPQIPVYNFGLPPPPAAR